jgi:hypothetical protein
MFNPNGPTNTPEQKINSADQVQTVEKSPLSYYTQEQLAAMDPEDRADLREDEAAYWESRKARSAESPKDKIPFVPPLNLDEGNGE